MNISKKGFGQIVVVALAVLAIPLVAMQFSDQVNWSVGDFIFGFLFLVSAGLLYRLILVKYKSVTSRILLLGLLGILLLLVLVELAVGIFD